MGKQIGSLLGMYNSCRIAVQIAASPALECTSQNSEALRATPRDPHAPSRSSHSRLTALVLQDLCLLPSSNFVSMLSLLVLLAPVGAETCNLKRSGQNGPLFSVLNVNPTVHPSPT